MQTRLFLLVAPILIVIGSFIGVLISLFSLFSKNPMKTFRQFPVIYNGLLFFLLNRKKKTENQDPGIDSDIILTLGWEFVRMDNKEENEIYSITGPNGHKFELYFRQSKSYINIVTFVEDKMIHRYNGWMPNAMSLNLIMEMIHAIKHETYLKNIPLTKQYDRI